jgi:hypothetical protein
MSQFGVLTNSLTFVKILVAAEISFIADVGGPLSPLLEEGFFMDKGQIRNCLFSMPLIYTSA